jgi:hypothetical protein
MSGFTFDDISDFTSVPTPAKASEEFDRQAAELTRLKALRFPIATALPAQKTRAAIERLQRRQEFLRKLLVQRPNPGTRR